MFARGVVSLHTPPLPGRKPSSVKSRVSITSKLIQTKGLQLHYFGHLRKTGGGGVTGWYIPLEWWLRITEGDVIKAFVTAQDITICGVPAFIAGNGKSDRDILVWAVEFGELSPVEAYLPGNPVGLID